MSKNPPKMISMADVARARLRALDGAIDDYARENPPEPPKSKPSGMLRRAGDVGLSAVQGAVDLVSAPVGLMSMATGGRAGKALEEAGFRPREAIDILQGMKSPEQQAADAAVQSQEGFIETLGAAMDNPSTIGHAIVRSAPSMLGGGIIARGVQRLAPAVSAAGGAAIGEGLIGAGTSAEQIRQQTPDGLLAGEQSAIAAGTGMMTGLINRAGGAISKRAGVGDVDTMVAGGGGAAGGGIVKKVAGGAASEGAEEMAQSAQEQIGQNVALGKDPMQGVGNATAMGLLSGGAMGGTAGAVRKAPAQVIREQKLPETGPLSKAVNAGVEVEAQKVEQVLSPRAPQAAGAQPANGAAEGMATASVSDPDMQTRVDQLRTKLAEPGVLDAVRAQFGPEGINDLTHYAGVATNPSIELPAKTRDNMLRMAEQMVAASLIDRIEPAPVPDAQPAIGMDASGQPLMIEADPQSLASTGRARVAPDGTVTRETGADLVNDQIARDQPQAEPVPDAGPQIFETGRMGEGRNSNPYSTITIEPEDLRVVSPRRAVDPPLLGAPDQSGSLAPVESARRGGTSSQQAITQAAPRIGAYEVAGDAARQQPAPAPSTPPALPAPAAPRAPRSAWEAMSPEQRDNALKAAGFAKRVRDNLTARAWSDLADAARKRVAPVLPEPAPAAPPAAVAPPVAQPAAPAPQAIEAPTPKKRLARRRAADSIPQVQPGETPSEGAGGSQPNPAESLSVQTAAQPVPPAGTHADPGKPAEPVTPSVVSKSIAKAAGNKDRKPSQMRADLLAMIDKAAADSESSSDNYVRFDVPGDGSFKIRNTKEDLARFREQVMKSTGFKDSKTKLRPDSIPSVRNGSGTERTAFENMVEEGDLEAASDYAEAVRLELDGINPKAKADRKVLAWRESQEGKSLRQMVDEVNAEMDDPAPGKTADTLEKKETPAEDATEDPEPVAAQPAPKPEASAPGAIPPAVGMRAKRLIDFLNEKKRALDAVQRARGDGHVLALEWEKESPAIKDRLATLDKMRAMAASNGLSNKFGELVESYGGEPDFSMYRTPQEVRAAEDVPPAVESKPEATKPQEPAADDYRPATGKFARYADALAEYGYGVFENGEITKGGKGSGVKLTEAGGRLKVKGLGGNLLFSGPATPDTAAQFVQKYWFAEKVKALKPAAAEPPSAPRIPPRLAGRAAAVAAKEQAASDDEPKGAKKFYVTVIRDGRTGWLAGPFDTKEQAEAQVQAARAKAEEVDPRTVFDAFGVTGLTAEKHPPGRLNDALGIKAGDAVAPKPEAAPAPAPKAEPAASLNKRHAIPKRQVLTPRGALKADATASRADSSVWFHQGDMQKLAFTASVIVDGKPDPRAAEARQTIERANAATKAGWSRTSYRAGSLGTVWVFERGDEFLTRAGFENMGAGVMAAPEMPDTEAGYEGMVAQQTALAKAFDDWLNTLPAEQQENRGVVSRKMAETPVGGWAELHEDKAGLTVRRLKPGGKDWSIALPHAKDWPALRRAIAEMAGKEAPAAPLAATTGTATPATPGATSTAVPGTAGSPAAPAAAPKAKAAGPAEKPARVIDRHESVMDAARAGTASPDEFRAAFAAVADAPDAVKAELSAMTKDKLLASMGPYFTARYKTETKPVIVATIYGEMLAEYAMGKDYGPSSYSWGQRAAYEAQRLQALRDLVADTTADDIAAFAKERAERDAELKAKRDEQIEGLKNPATLEQFNARIRMEMRNGAESQSDARMKLTPEQRAKYDELSAEATRSQREELKRRAAPQVTAASTSVAGQIVETTHTQKGHDLFVVQLAQRLERDDYDRLNASAKQMGGYYSSFRGRGAVPGFQFRDRASADAFLRLAGGDTAPAQQAVEARRDAFQDDRSQSAVERLREMANRLDDAAQEKLDQYRKTNTARRARFAASAMAAADAEKAMSKTMRNIAGAIESGKAKFLDAVRSKSQVELLENYLRSARDAELRQKYPTYAEQERRKGEPPTIATADHAEFPSFTAFRSDLAALGRALSDNDGTKAMGKRLLAAADDVTDAYLEFAKKNLPKVLGRFVTTSGGPAVFANAAAAENAIRRSRLVGKAVVLPIKRGENAIIISPSEAIGQGVWSGDGDKRFVLSAEFGSELVERLGKGKNKSVAKSLPWQFASAHERIGALKRMGVTTGAELRSAIREFIAMREQAVTNKAREMELAMVGRKNDGLDFFPTPAEIADQMVAAAEISPEMSVLEPSAGMGHIADRIRAAGAEPDVMEIAADRLELLQEKGYHVTQAGSFLDMKPREFFTFGDVFRAPDGKEGIMHGGKGWSGRGGLYEIGASGEAGVLIGWYDRAELTGVRHRGTDSGYDRIVMNPPFSDRRDAEHVRHAYSLLKPGGRLVAIMGEGVFFGQDKRAAEFREWFDGVGGTEEKLPPGSFMDPSLPVTTGVSARMVVIDKPAADSAPDATRFSRNSAMRRSDARAPRGIDLERVTAVASAIRTQWPGSPQVVVLADMDDPKAPDAVREEDRLQRSGGAVGGVEGFWHGGQVYLVAGSLRTEGDIARVLAHEVLGHHGLRGMFGPALDGILSQLVSARRGEVEAMARRYGLDTKSRADMLQAAEEVLAYMAQTKPELGFVRRAVAAIRSFLRGLGIGLRLSDDEIVRDFILPARGWVERGGSTAVPAVRFSRQSGQAQDAAADPPSITSGARDLAQSIGRRLSDFRGIGLQMLGRRQLTEVYGSDIPQLEAYSRMVAQMEADKNEIAADADEIAQVWGRLPDAAQLAELMHEATLSKIDADPLVSVDTSGVRADALRAKFKALSPEAQGVYRRARDIYGNHFDQMRVALRQRIERAEGLSSERRTKLLKEMDAEFFKGMQGVYFPLARFGDFVVVARGQDGTAVSVSRAETQNEAHALRKAMLEQFPAADGFTVSKVLKGKEYNAARDAVGRGFMASLFEAIGSEAMPDSRREELKDMLGQLYLSARPDTSWAKHGLHRKGTPGFSSDARRAFAQNVFHGARSLAKMRYADRLEDQLDKMQKHVDGSVADADYDSVKAQQVVDEMVKRHDVLMSPPTNPLSTTLTSVGFLYHMGLSPASAIVNLTQTALVAYPIMGARWGFARSAAALLKASNETASARNDLRGSLSGDEADALQQAIDAGTIDVTMAHDLAGIAQGEDSGVMWKMRPVMRAASFMFHHAERFNRQATFIAAYRMAREDGASHRDSVDAATKATYDAHFDLSSANRPRAMSGNVARVLLLFKSFAQNMIYTLGRAASQSMTGDREAQKRLGGILAMHLLFAGALGLPGIDVLLGMASMIGGGDDEEWDANIAMRNTLADAFGPEMGDVIAHGLSRATPWDISGRVGLDKLILPDVQEGLEGARWVESFSTAALGPVAGIGLNVAKGLQDIQQGHVARGIESMLPAAVRSPMKALRYEMEGAVDKTGVPIADDVSAAGVAGQALGFSPTEVRRAQEVKSAIFKSDKRLVDRRAALVSRHAMAAMTGDDEDLADVRERIAKWNAANPDRRISPRQLSQSVRQRAKRITQAKDGVYLPNSREDAREAVKFGGYGE